MASLANSINNYTSENYNGRWEDVQGYTSTRITVNRSDITSNNLTLQWDNPPNGIPANNQSPLYELVVPLTENIQTFECDHRGRWFRLFTNNIQAISISTMHKIFPSTIKITDGTDVVNVGNGLYTLLTDVSCRPLGTTLSNTNGAALYTTLTDSSGVPLSSLGCLSVALSDGIGTDITSLHNLGETGINAALCCNKSDNATQGSTPNVSGSYTEGTSLYLATSINSTYNMPSTSLDAVTVCLTDSQGHTDSAFHVRDTKILPILQFFDISQGMDVSATLCVTSACILYNLYCYNDGPVTSWVMLYDTSNVDIVNELAPVLSIPILHNDFHDIVLPKGCSFVNGICVQASKTQDYTNSISPGSNVVFASGTYYRNIISNNNEFRP